MEIFEENDYGKKGNENLLKANTNYRKTQLNSMRYDFYKLY